MKKKLLCVMCGLVLTISMIAGCSQNFQDDSVETGRESNNKTDGVSFTQIADDALSDVTEEEYEEIIVNMYEELDEEYIEEFDEMSGIEIKEQLDTFNDKYDVGDVLSEEDEALLLYTCQNYDTVEEENSEFETIAYVTRNYSIGNTKTSNNVKVGYSGTLSTYVTGTTGQYKTNVKITKYSGTVKSMKWKTSHKAYGLIGTSGKSASLGVVYSGSNTSSAYTSTFSFSKTQKYSAILAVYVSTWGTLDVKTSSGEFNMNTKTYSSTE